MDITKKVMQLENRITGPGVKNAQGLSCFSTDNKLMNPINFDELKIKDNEENNINHAIKGDASSDQQKQVKIHKVAELKIQSISNGKQQQITKEAEVNTSETQDEPNAKYSVSKGNSQNANPNVSSDNGGGSAGPKEPKHIKKRKYDKIEKNEKVNGCVGGGGDDPLGLKKLRLSYKQQNLSVYTAEDRIDNNRYTADGSSNSSGDNNNQINFPPKQDQLIQLNIAANNKKITDFFSGMNNGTTEKALVKKGSNNHIHANSKPKTTLNFPTKNHNGFLTEIPEDIYNEAWLAEKKDYLNKIRDLEQKIKEKEGLSSKLESEIKICQENYQNYQQKVQSLIAKYVLDNENMKRKDHKGYLQQQKQKLGEYVSQREGGRFVETWIDGTEMRQVKEKLAQINYEKEELEKIRRTSKIKKSTINLSKGETVQMSATTGVLSNMNTLTGNINFDSSDSNSNNDTLDSKERIASRMAFLSKEEQNLKEKLEKLEFEKLIFLQEYKKQFEEDHSRFGKINSDTNTPAWPILRKRYQLVSLLGKGGFSEVYKAYDLEELREVACKIHQLNPVWTENAKENYIKHAERETRIHQELSHPNIVKLYDTVDIDNHSFATILEYCEGPDLSLYLKRYKSIPEKDAKIFIRQILAGLKYLNDHPTRVIHYDLKPQNIIFHKGVVKISDFGLCKLVENNATRIELTSQGVGTYWYLPPECFELKDQPPLISNKVDVWSVGVIFFEMIFGCKPFGHNMSQEKILKEGIILKSYNVNFPPKPVIAQETKDFIKKCLAYHQEERMDVTQAYNHPYFTKATKQK